MVRKEVESQRRSGERWIGGIFALLGILVGGGLVLLTILLVRPQLLHWPVGEVIVGEPRPANAGRGCNGRFPPRPAVAPESEVSEPSQPPTAPTARRDSEPGISPSATANPGEGAPASDSELPVPPAEPHPVVQPTGAVVVEAPPGMKQSVRGRVYFTGLAPRQSPLNRSADPYCAKTKAFDERVIVNQNGTLRNVVVRIIGTPPAPLLPTNLAPAVIEQRDCTYQPHVLLMRTGQPFQIRNADGTLHNFHAWLGASTLRNQAQIPGSPPVQVKIAAADHSILHLGCDVHPWMNGYVVVENSPYFALTDEAGAYEIKDLPPGRYVMEAWHERFGKKQSAVVIEGNLPDVSFTYDGTEGRN